MTHWSVRQTMAAWLPGCFVSHGWRLEWVGRWIVWLVRERQPRASEVPLAWLTSGGCHIRPRPLGVRVSCPRVCDFRRMACRTDHTSPLARSPAFCMPGRCLGMHPRISLCSWRMDRSSSGPVHGNVVCGGCLEAGRQSCFPWMGIGGRTPTLVLAACAARRS